jgi:hypothetical protein
MIMEGMRVRGRGFSAVDRGKGAGRGVPLGGERWGGRQRQARRDHGARKKEEKMSRSSSLK